MLATLREPPPRGSVQDIILQALIVKKDQIEYAKTKVIVQTLFDKEKAQEALEEYRDLQFPYYQGVQRKEREANIKRLMAEVTQGAMTVTPLWSPKVKSKLKTKVIERSPEEQVEVGKRLSKRLGGFT